MDRTIRNLDEAVFRTLKARAAIEGKTVGEAVNEAMAAYVARPVGAAQAAKRLSDLAPTDLGAGTETLSDDIDAVVYGV
jgi:plasmid stability protein